MIILLGWIFCIWIKNVNFALSSLFILNLRFWVAHWFYRLHVFHVSLLFPSYKVIFFLLEIKYSKKIYLHNLMGWRCVRTWNHQTQFFVLLPNFLLLDIMLLQIFQVRQNILIFFVILLLIFSVVIISVNWRLLNLVLVLFNECVCSPN